MRLWHILLSEMARTANTFKHATIIGVGLLGGSVALGLRKAYPGIAIAGVGRGQPSLDQALRSGIIDAGYLSPVEPAAKSDLIILATPVGSFKGHLRAMAPVVRKDALVTDVGSTKAIVVAIAEKILGRGGPFVGSHPMAGSERKGNQFARADLLVGAMCVITPTPATPPALLARAEALWLALGMKVVQMTPARHDQAAAEISHLPHMLSALLMLLPSQAAMDISAGGFKDMTRICGSDVEMWRDIILTNAKPIGKAMKKYALSITNLLEMIEAGDIERIEKLLSEARQARESFLNRK
jgi:prephenate dehydrogenase